MLSDVEKQAAERWSIESNRVCEGGAHPGRDFGDSLFCFIRRNPQECMISGKSEDLSSGER